jgi:hypothetical protein
MAISKILELLRFYPLFLEPLMKPTFPKKSLKIKHGCFSSEVYDTYYCKH